MTYQRVIPRDVFNEAKLLKCLGQLCLLIEDRKCDLVVEHFNSFTGFRIIRDDSDGGLMCTNLQFYRKVGNQLKPQEVYSAMNARDPYPLLTVSAATGEEIEVLNDDGTLTEDFKRAITHDE